MGLFKKNTNEEAPRRNGNSTNMILIRLLAVGYVLWMLKEMVVMYIEGGEEAPSLLILVITAVLFLGGSAWILWMTYKQYKQMKAQQAEEAAALAAEEAALEAAQAEKMEDWEEDLEEVPEENPEEE